MTTATYTLTKVIELREYDEGLECYISLPKECRVACAHCGALCQKLYEVTRDQDGVTFLIGPSCAKKSLFGWEPEKAVANKMAKEADKLAKDRARQRLIEIAAPIATEVKSLSIPQIVQVGTSASGVAQYGMVESGVKIWCREGLTEERTRCCKQSWQQEQVRNRLTITNDRKRSKVQEIAYGLLIG